MQRDLKKRCKANRCKKPLKQIQHATFPGSRHFFLVAQHPPDSTTKVAFPAKAMSQPKRNAVRHQVPMGKGELWETLSPTSKFGISQRPKSFPRFSTIFCLFSYGACLFCELFHNWMDQMAVHQVVGWSILAMPHWVRRLGQATQTAPALTFSTGRGRQVSAVPWLIENETL